MTKLKMDWMEFVAHALNDIRAENPSCFTGMPEFKQQNGYEPDSECFTFPPAYVEIELKRGDL